MIPFVALILAVVALFLAIWIFVPAPTYFLLTFGVGAPEVSAWLALLSLVALAVAAFGWRESSVAKWAATMAVASLVLSITPWVRLPATIRRLDAATREMSLEPKDARRAHPVVIADLFAGVSLGDARITRDIKFATAGGTQLTLDVYQPTRSGHFPIVVQVYGHAWQGGVPSDYPNFATWFAASGYVVIAIDYRHAPASRWPAQSEDVDTALAWIRDHAAEYDGDTSRVVLVGRSAGAHLAMLAAYRSGPLPVRGVVSFYGPTDLADGYRNPPHPDPLDVRFNERALLGGTPDDMPDRYKEASPITYASRQLPPTLLIYGGRDHIVEPRYGARLADALHASGNSAAYLEIPWAEHAFDKVFNGPSSQLSLYYAERFIAWATR